MANRNSKNNNAGFTLAEMLVTVGVFAIAMTVSSSIFINVNNLQQQTANMAKLQNEGRYLMEKISKEIRGREFDYAASASAMDQATGKTTELVFKKDEFGEIYKLYFGAEAINLDINDAGVGVPLNSSEVAVADLKFIVSPISDPYPSNGSVPAVLQQPRITVLMVIRNKDVPAKYMKTLRLQTTVSSKVYK